MVRSSERPKKKKKSSRACAFSARLLSSVGLSWRFSPHVVLRGAPETWTREPARRAPAQSLGPRGRLRTSVPDPRVAGLLEVERREGARQEAAAVTARAWSRGRWSPPPPPLPPCSLSGRAGGFHARLAETEGERKREREGRRRIQGVGAGEPSAPQVKKMMMMMMMIIKQPSPRSALAFLQCRPHMQWLPAPASPSAAQDESRLPACRRRLPGRPGGCGCRCGRGVVPPLVCARPGSAWGLGGARGGSPSSRAGRARRLLTPARLPALAREVGVWAARPAAARGQSLAAGRGLHFLLGQFPCSLQPWAARFLPRPEAKPARNPKWFKMHPLEERSLSPVIKET